MKLEITKYGELRIERAGINKNIEVLERAIERAPEVIDSVLLIDTKLIPEGIRKQLPE